MTSASAYTGEGIGLNRLCAGFAEGLHAAAQPLTVLRMRLDEELCRGMDAETIQANHTNSLAQVDVFCTLLQYLQELVDVATTAPRRETVETSAVLDDVAEGLERVVAEAGMKLCRGVCTVSMPIAIDARRMRQALSEAVLVAFRLSRASATIQMNALQAAGMVSFSIRSSQATLGALEAPMRLALAVADANVRSLGGELFLSRDPFAIQIEMPVVRVAGQDGEGWSAREPLA